VYRSGVMRHLLFIAFAFSFAGASCETPSGLTRPCPGSKPQTAYYSVTGDCGGYGVITVSVANADSCAIGVLEPTSVGLPTVGAFSDLASQTGYDLDKGNWNLNDPSEGIMNVGTFLSCTSGTAKVAGHFDLNCEQEVCSVGEDEVTCMTGVPCTAHLAETTADAGAVVVPQDAGDSGS
jgi:hypothetical protein